MPTKKNCVVEESDGYRVRFGGQLQSPNFLSRGAAIVFLQGLMSGIRKPEPETT